MIIATAGHVDHGKTSLVKHLTGVDTDRTQEEQRRGLSINLGYAYRDSGQDLPLGFIDVPGHSRFLNTMIAGVSGIDLGLLVVAADDGPMPQTREHLDILNLLGVERFLLVISKIDRVDDARLAEVTAACQSLLSENVPVFPISNTEGSGISELASELDRLAAQPRPEIEERRFRMSLDRAFHVKGAGIVVTGTAASGSVQVDEELLLQPQNLLLRVRAIHAQDNPVSRAVAGQRVALNVTGPIEREQLNRGDWLADPAVSRTTTRFDAVFHLLPGLPFQPRHLAPVKLYIGARRVEARLFFIDAEGGGRQLCAEESSLVQLLVDEPVLCHRGDRFLLRDYGETALLGGGQVLDPRAPRYGKSRGQRLATLDALQKVDPADAAKTLVLQQAQVIDWNNFCQDWNLSAAASQDVLDELVAQGCEYREQQGRQYLVSAEVWQSMKQQLLDLLGDWHKANPAEPGVSPAQLRDKLAPFASRPLITELLLELIQAGSMVMQGGLVSVHDFEISVPAEESQAWSDIEKSLTAAGRDLPTVLMLRESLGISAPVFEQAVATAVRSGRLYRVGDSRLALSSTLLDFSSVALGCDGQGRGFTVKDFRDASGVGRNLSIEILEFFDQLRFTRRQDQVRTIIDSELPQERFSG